MTVYCKTYNELMETIEKRNNPPVLLGHDEVFREGIEGKQWGKFIKAMYSGAPIEIDDAMYYRWLEILPPVYQFGWQFGFAEGSEHIVDFWKHDGRFYCQKTELIFLGA